MRLEIAPITKYEVQAIDFCLKKVVNLDVPATPEEVGYLMELMLKVASQYDTTNWVKPGVAMLDLDLNEADACWKCLTFCLKNKLVRNEEKKILVARASFLLAQFIDAAIEEANAIDDEEKSNPKLEEKT